MSDFLPGYDDWKTTDPADNPKPKKKERDPDIAREDQIERERLRREDDEYWKNVKEGEDDE